MREMRLTRKVKLRDCHTANSPHPYPRSPKLVDGAEVTYPDQVWYLTSPTSALMDVSTRSIRGWNLSQCLDKD